MASLKRLGNGLEACFPLNLGCSLMRLPGRGQLKSLTPDDAPVMVASTASSNESNELRGPPRHLQWTYPTSHINAHLSDEENLISPMSFTGAKQ